MQWKILLTESPGIDFICKDFRTVLDFSSAAAGLHQWKTESDTLLNNGNVTFYLAGMLLLRRQCEISARCSFTDVH